MLNTVLAEIKVTQDLKIYLNKTELISLEEAFSTRAFIITFHPTGYKIPVLENLGATLDQFDTVDFSDNEVRKLDGFPLLKRLKTLLMNNNRIW